MWYSRSLILVAFLLPGLLLGLGPTHEGEDTQVSQAPALQIPDIEQLPLATVTRVLDSNTVLVEIDGRHIRYDLLGVSSQSGAEARQARLDEARATRALKRMVLGEVVAVQADPQGERSSANRFTAYLFRTPDRMFVNLEMVRQGLARHRDSSMTLYLDSFEFYQERASELGRGIWDPDRDPMGDTQPSSDDEDDEPTIEKEKPTQVPVRDTQGVEPAEVVYVTKYGKKYHRKDCPHLTDSAKPAKRSEIKDSHEACKTCKPDG